MFFEPIMINCLLKYSAHIACTLRFLVVLWFLVFQSPCVWVQSSLAQDPLEANSPNRNREGGSNPQRDRDEERDKQRGQQRDQQSGQPPERRGGQGGQGGGGAGRGGTGGKGGGGGGSGLGGYVKPPSPANDVPSRPYDIILGRPTKSSITVRTLPFEQGQGRIRYRAISSTPSSSIAPEQQTDWLEYQSHSPLNIELSNLLPNTRYNYFWEYRTNQNSTVESSPEFSFHTQRSSSDEFAFTVSSDSHLDENSSGEVYLRTLANAYADQPDFHLELGDTFMTGKYKQPEFSYGHYLSQRYYFGSICHSVPLFFVVGNHDGESTSRGNTLWATRTRKSLFPNPSPNDFYSGNKDQLDGIGNLDDYYAWQWGDALFIALDPYRYTTERPRRGESNTRGNWFWTLGDAQYQWFKSVLEKSDAKYRFVFIHHLVGGADQNNRGGSEAAPYWEWGGKSSDGQDEFKKYRPGWEKPIHSLLIDHGVQIVFHGHDHIFAKQDLDGIVYQEVPQPSHARVGNTRTAAEYGYLSGEIQPSSGHIRVRVSSESCRVDYVRSYLPKDENGNRKNGDVGYSYQVAPFLK